MILIPESCYICGAMTERTCALCHKAVCGVHSKQKYLKGSYTSTVCDQCVPKANKMIKIYITVGLSIFAVIMIWAIVALT